jgi:arylsulfatase A-like enzyme
LNLTIRTSKIETMTRNFFISALGIGAVSLLPSGCSSDKKTETQKPNIIYILADDLGWGDLSYNGQDAFETKNIDRLAAEGLIFTRHYAGSTVCAPSRASLLTGKHTGNVSVRVNLDNLVDDSEATIASVLKEAGYSTGLIGKWGIGHPPPNDDPKRKGFDYAYGYINMWHAHNFYPDFLVRNGVEEKIEGNVIGEYVAMVTWDDPKPAGVGYSIEKAQYSPDLFEKDALRFIQENKDNPFFLFLPFTIPHANNEADNGMEIPDYGIFADKDWPEPEKGFAAQIVKLDKTIGLIRAKLEELGIAENTLLIFTSDNGPHQEGGHKVDFFNSNGNLRGTKRDLYEGGIRVPTVAWWPAKIKPGRTTDHVSAFWDVLPTFCEIAGVDKPEGLDGISFLPTLVGNTEEQKQHEYLYWEFFEANGRQAVMIGDYKGIIQNLRKEPFFELYDLSVDESESNNIAADHPELEKEMRRLFRDARTEFYIPLEEFSKYYPEGLQRAF